jgi:hypothetical protein
LRAQVDLTQAVAGYLDVSETVGTSSSLKDSIYRVIGAEESSREQEDRSGQQQQNQGTVSGKIVVYGDSNCFDMISLTKGNNNPGCLALMKSFLDFIVSGSSGLGATMGATSPAASAPGWPYLMKVATRAGVFSKPELMGLSGGGQAQLSAEDQRKLAIERKGRQWEFSR